MLAAAVQKAAVGLMGQKKSPGLPRGELEVDRCQRYRAATFEGFSMVSSFAAASSRTVGSECT